MYPTLETRQETYDKNTESSSNTDENIINFTDQRRFRYRRRNQRRT